GPDAARAARFPQKRDSGCEETQEHEGRVRLGSCAPDDAPPLLAVAHQLDVASASDRPAVRGALHADGTLPVASAHDQLLVGQPRDDLQREPGPGHGEPPAAPGPHPGPPARPVIERNQRAPGGAAGGGRSQSQPTSSGPSALVLHSRSIHASPDTESGSPPTRTVPSAPPPGGENE